MTRDTGKARLPALPAVNTIDPSLRAWLNAAAERLEVREGSRGNPFEAAVTVRDLEAALAGLVKISPEMSKDPNAATSISLGNGLFATLQIDKFAESLRSTRLYQDLMKRLDDPSRFDHLSNELRSVLLKSIADEALARGTAIRTTETTLQNDIRALAMKVTEVTASTGSNAAGVRELTSAYTTSTAATAVKITQLESSLGKYYQDGSPGRVSLETEQLTQASQLTGLRAQYTVKVQAGGALAGFGLASTEVNGTPSSAFIINADKFAIVAPNYTGGLTNSPNLNNVPFGVDANGVYIKNNVYIQGGVKIDAAGPTLSSLVTTVQGARGSVEAVATGQSSWSDTVARQAVWTALGKTGAPTDNTFLSIGDQVTLHNKDTGGAFIATKYWTGPGAGFGWKNAGVAINGSTVVRGTLSASQISTNEAFIGHQINGGAFTSFAWPASGGGFHLSGSGLLIGNWNVGAGSVGYVDIRANGTFSIGAPGQPKLALSNGVLTIDEANVIKTLNIQGDAVTIPRAVAWGGSYTHPGVFEYRDVITYSATFTDSVHVIIQFTATGFSVADSYFEVGYGPNTDNNLTNWVPLGFIRVGDYFLDGIVVMGVTTTKIAAGTYTFRAKWATNGGGRRIEQRKLAIWGAMR